MTVRELIAKLHKLPQDLQVIMQSDSEGNGHSQLYDFDAKVIYIRDTKWSGKVYSTGLSVVDADVESDSKWENFKAKNPKCCVLVPVK